MQPESWSLDCNRYDSVHGLSLIRADEQEWRVYYSIYGSSDHGVLTLLDEEWDPSLSFQSYWIMENEHRLGGVRITSQHLQRLFLIPPCSNLEHILTNLLDILQRVTQPALPVYACEILAHQWDAWSRMGFRPSGPPGRWMRRPTYPAALTEADQVELMNLQDVLKANDRMLKEKEIAFFIFQHGDLMKNASDKKGDSLSETLEWLKKTISQLSPKALQASSLIIDQQTRRLIGVCLIEMKSGCDLVRYIGSLGGQQGQDAIKSMVKHALLTLHGESPVLSIYVEQGELLEGICYRLGFQPGPLQLPRMVYSRS